MPSHNQSAKKLKKHRRKRNRGHTWDSILGTRGPYLRQLGKRIRDYQPAGVKALVDMLTDGLNHSSCPV